MANIEESAQTITLRDGRILGYGEWGDLTGIPVFFISGSTNARLIRHPDDSIITELGIHLYTFDRPGLGLSTRKANRTLLDWADDIRDFVQQKEITRFAVVAASQGGPYGTACAYALPDLLSSVSLVSAVSPLDDPDVMASQQGAIRTMIFMARKLPWLLTLQYRLMSPMIEGKHAEGMIKAMLKNLPQSDQAVMNMSGATAFMVEDIREAMKQGGQGATDDMRAVVGDWGFKLEDIQSKVFIWQGEDDPNVTPIMARYLAERIPNCETRFVPKAGHMLVYSHWREILEQVLAHWKA